MHNVHMYICYGSIYSNYSMLSLEDIVLKIVHMKVVKK